MASFFRWLWDCVTGLFQPVISFFYAVWDFLYSLMAQVGNWILDAFWWLVGVFVWLFWVCFDSLAALSYSAFAFLMDCLPEFHIPEAYSSAAVSAMQIIATIDCFIPVATFLACILLYTAFLVGWCVYKFVKSWIPTVSGS